MGLINKLGQSFLEYKNSPQYNFKLPVSFQGTQVFMKTQKVSKGSHFNKIWTSGTMKSNWTLHFSISIWNGQAQSIPSPAAQI